MNVYNLSSLVAFYTKHPDCKQVLQKWYNDVSTRVWIKPSDVTQDYNTARTIKNNRAIFKINENNYRLIVEFNYIKGWAFVKFIGTHAEYDMVDPETVNQFKSKPDATKKDKN